MKRALQWLIMMPLFAGTMICAAQTQEQPPTETIWLSTLDVSRIEQGWGEGRSDRSVGNRRLTIAGRVFRRGIGTHANSNIPLLLDGNAVELSGWVGVDDETRGRGSLVFQMRADMSITMINNGKPRLDAPPLEDAVILTPKPAPTPRINGAKVFGVRPGSPFLFKIAATGDRPMTFSADGLPAGLHLDTEAGLIVGRLDKAGEHGVTHHAGRLPIGRFLGLRGCRKAKPYDDLNMGGPNGRSMPPGADDRA